MSLESGPGSTAPGCCRSQNGSKVTVGGWEENSPAPHGSLLLGALLYDGVEGGGVRAACKGSMELGKDQPGHPTPG